MEIVYKITNTTNNKFYFGSTSDFEFRMFTHNKYSHCNFTKLHKELYEDILSLGFDKFNIEKIDECEDIVKSSRLESSLIRQNIGNPLMYNVSLGASGRRVFYEEDIRFIRKLYKSKEIYIEDAYDNFYKDIVTFRAFKKVWHGETFKDISYDVYTEENKSFHFKHGQSRVGEVNGTSKYTEKEVLEIRKRKQNGETKASVYKDFEYKNARGGFEGIWLNQTWKHLL